MDKVIEIKSRRVVAMGWGRRIGNYCLVLVWDDEKVLEMEGGDLCATV